MREPKTKVDAETYPKVNLGCGEDHRGDMLNVDVRAEVDPDLVVDLDEQPWPLPSNHYEHVLIANVLEHLPDQLGALEELHRITAPGGTIDVRIPHPNSRCYWVDPTHARPIHPATFRHPLSPDWCVDRVEVGRVRFGRVLPESWALWWADHLGFIVDECRIILSLSVGD